LLSTGRHLGNLSPAVLPRDMIGMLPEKIGKRTEFLLDKEHSLGVFSGGFDLQPVADNAWVTQKTFDVRIRKVRNLFNGKSGKSSAVILAFSQDGQPTQTRLGTLEDEHFKEPLVIVERQPPFSVVIIDRERVAAAPRTSVDLIG